MAQPEPERAHLHFCALALTAEQAEHVQTTRTVLKDWFGDGRSVPVKNNLETAVAAFVTANSEDPAKTILFYLPLPNYHDWVHKGYMQVCPWVKGYRVKRGIDLLMVDLEYTLHHYA